MLTICCKLQSYELYITGRLCAGFEDNLLSMAEMCSGQLGGPAPPLAALQRLLLLALAQQDWMAAAGYAFEMSEHYPELAQAGFDAALEGVRQFEQSRPKGWSPAVCQGFCIDGSPCFAPAVDSGYCDRHESQSSSSSSSGSPNSSISSNDGIKSGNGCVGDFLHRLNSDVCTQFTVVKLCGQCCIVQHKVHAVRLLNQCLCEGREAYTACLLGACK